MEESLNDLHIIDEFGTDPEFFKDPYSREKILMSMNMKDLNLDEINQKKKEFLMCFEHFFSYFLLSLEKL